MVAQKKQYHGVVTTHTINCWSEVVDYYKNNFPELKRGHWVFRGNTCSTWSLETTFERAPKGKVKKNRFWKYEAAMLREFIRRTHHYISDLPKNNETLEWFALMRHFGAPSRLLDFSYSFYVAAYFAFRDSKDDGEVAVWAVNTESLGKYFSSLLSPKQLKQRQGDFRFKDTKDFRRYYLNTNPTKTFVAPVNAFRLNQRLCSQQGLFLCPSNIGLSFMDNLKPCINAINAPIAHKISIDAAAKEDALRDLRKMNITSATLFPDLGGFAGWLSDWFYLDFKFIDKDLISILNGQLPGN